MHFAHPGLADPEYYVAGSAHRLRCPALRHRPRADRQARVGRRTPSAPRRRPRTPLIDALDRLHLYPSWTAEPLREKIAEVYGYTPEQVVCGAGETEIISLIIRAFCEPGGRILMPGPCFPIYHLFAEAEGRIPVLAHAATDRARRWRWTSTPTSTTSPPDTRIVFITNPHSPSGTWMSEADVRRIIEAAPQALVVLDEAYVHYSDTPGLHPPRPRLRTSGRAPHLLEGVRAGRAPDRLRGGAEDRDRRVAGGQDHVEHGSAPDRRRSRRPRRPRARASAPSTPSSPSRAYVQDRFDDGPRASTGSGWSPAAAPTSSWSRSSTPTPIPRRSSTGCSNGG